MHRNLIVAGTFALSAFAVPAFAVTSSFSAGAEGWTAQGDVSGPLTWSATGGNPGGHVSIEDAVTGGTTYFAAPSSFHGDFSGAIGTDLTFDLQQVYTGTPSQFDNADVILRGGGLTITHDTANNPANGSWTSYAVPLQAAAWMLSGSPVSASQFATVMGSLTSLQIRAEYRNGADTGMLDNVTLVPEPSTYALWLGGLAALAGLRQRRRAQP